MELITHHIDGEDVESVSGARFDSVDPFTQSAYAEVALGGQGEVDRGLLKASRSGGDTKMIDAEFTVLVG
ncbi:MAG TPA: hypothetical protein PK324_09635, partial [Nocardioides sp.]|nr:hypothetical protein [Nocardioides sp.]